jgi:hypothetical protein
MLTVLTLTYSVTGNDNIGIVTVVAYFKTV